MFTRKLDPSSPNYAIELSRIDGAFQNTLNNSRVSWNAQQTELIKQTRTAEGGIVIGTGPRGVGKTEVCRAIAKFARELDYHVMFLAPTNSNCDVASNGFHTGSPDMGIILMYPAALSSTLVMIGRSRKLAHSVARSQRIMHARQTTSSWSPLPVTPRRRTRPGLATLAFSRQSLTRLASYLMSASSFR